MTSEHHISPAFVFWSGTTCRKNANPARKLAKNKNSIRKTRVLTRQVCLPCFSLSTAKDQRRNFWSNKVTLFILFCTNWISRHHLQNLPSVCLIQCRTHAQASFRHVLLDGICFSHIPNVQNSSILRISVGMVFLVVQNKESVRSFHG